MLTISDKKPKPLSVSLPPPNNYTLGKKTLHTIATERDSIVYKLSQSAPYKVGDWVIPIHKEDEEKYGKMEVLHICTSYADLGKDYEWPKNNNPMIVTCKDAQNHHIFCTVNYVKKVPNAS